MPGCGSGVPAATGQGCTARIAPKAFGAPTVVVSRCTLVRRAGTFFVDAIRPIEQTQRAIPETNVHLSQVNQTLRERVEMVRGSFAVVSAPGQGTTIPAQIPFRNGV